MSSGLFIISLRYEVILIRHRYPEKWLIKKIHTCILEITLVYYIYILLLIIHIINTYDI